MEPSAQQAPPSIDEALSFAIDAVNRGDISKGKAALEWVLRKDPDNVNAWLWMACCMPNDSDRQACYRKVNMLQSRN